MSQVEIAILVVLGLVVAVVAWATFRAKPATAPTASNTMAAPQTITVTPTPTSDGLFSRAFTSGLQRADQIVHDRTADGVANTMLALLGPTQAQAQAPEAPKAQGPG